MPSDLHIKHPVEMLWLLAVELPIPGFLSLWKRSVLNFTECVIETLKVYIFKCTSNVKLIK